MTGTALQTADAVDTWREVIALLAEAADRGYQEAITNPAAHSTALAADGLASAAIALLPEDLDHEVDEVALDAVVAHLDSAGLIRSPAVTPSSSFPRAPPRSSSSCSTWSGRSAREPAA